MDDLAYRSAAQVAEAIRSRKLASRDYLEAMLARIEKLDGPLNTVVTIDADRARREADAADTAIARGEATGPLHGVCMTVKDSFQTQGMRTTSGAPAFSDHVPTVDAAPVAHLRKAGAVIVGKTNLPIFAGDAQTYNEVFGQSNNPWNTERTVGGSSGGAAGALAAGLTPLEVGSDIGGSIRGPATTCGVTGHKPSYGIVSALGQIPGPPGTLTQADLAVAGPMARDVADLELALEIMAGPDEWHGVAYRFELPPARHRELAGFRVAVWLDEASAPVDREVRTLIEAAARRLSDDGARVDATARPAFDFERAVDTFRALLSGALSGGVSREAIEALAAREGDDEIARVSRDTSMRHRQWLSLNERRLQMRQRWHEFFADWDAVLMPALPAPAIPHDHSEPQAGRTIQINGETRPYLELLHWMGPAGLAYLPATVVPVGVTSEGLPVGVQIVGPFLEDRTPLALAGHLFDRIGFEKPPGY